MPLLKLFNILDSFKEDVMALYAITSLQENVHFQYHTLLYLVSVQDISATTKGVWSIFLLKDFNHETWIEILLSFKNVSIKQL